MAAADYVGREMLYNNAIGKRETYIPDLYTKAALNFVKNNVPDQFNHYRPFFLLLDFKIPGKKIEVPTDAPFSSEAWPQLEKNKAALISRIDDYVGQLAEQLQKSGMTNNVVIFFSSARFAKKFRRHGPAILSQHAFDERSARADDRPLAGENSRRPGQRVQVVAARFSADGGGNCLCRVADQHRRHVNLAGAVWRDADQPCRDEIASAQRGALLGNGALKSRSCFSRRTAKLIQTTASTTNNTTAAATNHGH